jgi:hypothetical protein
MRHKSQAHPQFGRILFEVAFISQFSYILTTCFFFFVVSQYMYKLFQFSCIFTINFIIFSACFWWNEYYATSERIWTHYTHHWEPPWAYGLIGGCSRVSYRNFILDHKWGIKGTSCVGVPLWRCLSVPSRTVKSLNNSWLNEIIVTIFRSL